MLDINSALILDAVWHGLNLGGVAMSRKGMRKHEKLSNIYTCDTCGNIFMQSSHLKEHEMTHTVVQTLRM